jgi:hypothetical protein
MSHLLYWREDYIILFFESSNIAHKDKLSVYVPVRFPVAAASYTPLSLNKAFKGSTHLLDICLNEPPIVAELNEFIPA